MMMTSRAVKLAAGAVAVCAHGALAVSLMPEADPVAMEGSSGGVSARLGTSFMDMAQGSIAAQSVDTPIEAEQPDALAPVTPPVQATASVAPQTLAAVRPMGVTPVEAAQVAVLPTETQSALKSEAVAAERPETTTLVATTPTETIEVEPDAEEEAERAELKEHKPAPRPKRPAPQKPAPEKKVTETPKRPASKAAQQGNAQSSARAGQVDGQRDAKSVAKGTKGNSAEAGNAAVSNYPGLVMRRLSRVSRPRVSARGSAVVAFSIAPNGGLASVGIARSSGSQALDNAALKVVQRAAPFPAPPQGARRSFSISIEGR